MPDDNILTLSKDLLDSYIHNMSGWKQFFTGNNSNNFFLAPFNCFWGRHHLPEVRAIRARMDEDAEFPVQHVVDLLHQLHSIQLVNPAGALARRIDAIWEWVLQENAIQQLAQEVSNPHSKVNGLILAIQYRPQYVQRIIQSIIKLDNMRKIESLLKNALVFTLGEKGEIRDPDSGKLVYRDWHYLSATQVIIWALGPLTFSEKKTIVLPALHQAIKCNRLDMYEKLLKFLFARYSKPPSDNYLTWLRVTLSGDDDIDGVLRAIHQAIGENSMYIPSWLMGKTAPNPNSMFQPLSVMLDEEDHCEVIKIPT